MGAVVGRVRRGLHQVCRLFTTPAVRYPPDPRALFLLLMCVISGVPLLFGDAAPQSIVAQLDKPWVIGWGIMLVGGGGVTLLGSLRQTAGGVIAEGIGSIALGFACLVYAVAIYASTHVWGVVALLLLGFGGACLIRVCQLVAYLFAVEHLAQELRGDQDG